jgi:hypothetical protein
VLAFHLVQSWRDRIAAHLDLTGPAVADRLAALVGDPNLKAVGDMVERGAEPIAACA